MTRRTLLRSALAAAVFETPLLAALRQSDLDEAAGVLSKAVESGQVAAAVLHVTQRESSFTKKFGTAVSEQAMFLLGSISKPICVTALMTLFDRGRFGLDDPLEKFIPQFTGDGRDGVTMRHLLTHTSGLPDQLSNNDTLRKNHTPLPEFAAHAARAPLGFPPGSRYQYSSMGILLACHVGQELSGIEIKEFMDRAVFEPLGMKHSALGVGRFRPEDMVLSQTDRAAPESGGGDPSAKDWDWNSPYWRKLGAPWGGVHASAPDIALWLNEFLAPRAAILKPATARFMITNQNPAGLTPRGLGFSVGASAGSPGCSDQTFGHTGSTGTLCWTDPVTQTTCVALTSLPARAVQPHPRDLASRHVAAAAG